MSLDFGRPALSVPAARCIRELFQDRRSKGSHPHRRADPLAESDWAIGPRSSYAMFSIVDFLPTPTRLAGGRVSSREHRRAHPEANRLLPPGGRGQQRHRRLEACLRRIQNVG